MKKAVAFIILLTAANLFAQKGTIEGNIRLDNGENAINVHIKLSNSNITTISDFDGHYVLKNIPYGSYELTFSSIEAEDTKFTINLNSPILTKNITLKVKENQLEEVVVEGQSKATQVETKGLAVNAIETKDVVLQSVQTNELLDRSAGIIVRTQGGLGSRVSYNINGVSGNGIRFFIDGIPMEYFGASYSLNSIPTTAIERMEVYKGVVPIELGNDILGGAVNIITKEAFKNSLDLSYSYGSFNTHQASANGLWRDKNSGLTVKGNLFYNYSDNNYTVKDVEAYIGDPLDGVEGLIDAERFNDGYWSYGGKFDIGFTGKSWADKLYLSLVYSDMEKEMQTGATMEVVFGERKYTSTSTAPSINYIKKDLFTKGLDVNVFGMYSDLKRQTIDTTSNEYDWGGFIGTGFPGEQNLTLNIDDETTYIGRINTSYKLKNGLKIATNYISTDFTRSSDDELLTDEERALQDDRGYVKNVLGVALESNDFIKNLQSSIFIKFYDLDVNVLARSQGFNQAVEQEEISNTYNNTAYGVALSYKLSPALLLQLSAENGVRLPEAQEVFGNTAENMLPNYNLEPEKNVNANFGVNFGPFYLGDHRFLLNTNAFYRDITDMIRQTANDEDEFSNENLEDVINTGMDLSFSYDYKNKIGFTTNMSFLEARFNTQYDSAGAEYLWYKSRIPNEPYFTLNSNLNYNVQDLFQSQSRTTFSYNLKYVHRFFRIWEVLGGANEAYVPSQFSHDIGITYMFPNQPLSISFDAKNILDEVLFDNFGLQKPGRAFYIKMNYAIN